MIMMMSGSNSHIRKIGYIFCIMNWCTLPLPTLCNKFNNSQKERWKNWLFHLCNALIDNNNNLRVFAHFLWILKERFRDRI